MKKSIALSCDEFRKADEVLWEVNAALYDLGISADVFLYKKQEC